MLAVNDLVILNNPTESIPIRRYIAKGAPRVQHNKLKIKKMKYPIFDSKTKKLTSIHQ